MTDQQIIAATQAWLKNFIIAYDICPFARREQERGSIHYQIARTSDLPNCLEALVAACQLLDAQSEVETTLLLLVDSFESFDDFLDLLAIAEQLLVDLGYEGVYQLASFHPQYQFDGTDEADPSNYTNRSPYPMLHIIREASIDRALKNYPQPELIPERNIALTRKIGLEKLQQLLRVCYSDLGGLA